MVPEPSGASLGRLTVLGPPPPPGPPSLDPLGGALLALEGGYHLLARSLDAVALKQAAEQLCAVAVVLLSFFVFVVSLSLSLSHSLFLSLSLSLSLSHRRIKLMVHVVRRADTDLMKQPSFRYGWTDAG